MAQLLGYDALKKINALLKELENTNKFLETDNPQKIYNLSFSESGSFAPAEDEEAASSKGNKKKKAKAPVIAALGYAEDKELIDQLVRNHKDRVVKEILDLADKYSIELDEYDQKVLGLIE